ncbi:MAG: CBS domain-containing protein [archaeon]
MVIYINKQDTKHIAEEFITEDIISVKPEDKIEDASKIMKENDFSQLPVKDKGRYIEMVTSQDIAMSDNKEMSVNRLDYHIPRRIPYDTPKDNFKYMLKSNKALLVQKGSRVVGIITSANLLVTFEP